MLTPEEFERGGHLSREDKTVTVDVVNKGLNIKNNLRSLDSCKEGHRIIFHVFSTIREISHRKWPTPLPQRTLLPEARNDSSPNKLLDLRRYENLPGKCKNRKEIYYWGIYKKTKVGLETLGSWENRLNWEFTRKQMDINPTPMVTRSSDVGSHFVFNNKTWTLPRSE